MAIALSARSAFLKYAFPSTTEIIHCAFTQLCGDGESAAFAGPSSTGSIALAVLIDSRTVQSSREGVRFRPIAPLFPPPART